MSVSIEFQRRFKEIIADIDCENASMAETLGITYFSYERAFNYGILPSIPILMRLADNLNISIEFLLGRTSNEYFYKSENPNEFLNRFEVLKNEQGLTYYEISKRTHIATNTISNWKKRNSPPKLEQLIILSEFFKVNLDYLLGRCDDKEILTISI